MQLLLAGVSLALAMASSTITSHQSAVHQPAQDERGLTQVSFEDFIHQKQIQKRKAYLDEWKKEVSPSGKHKVSLSAFSSHLHQRVPAPVLYIPKIGVENVTKPTELPPPPPTLNPNTDMQPFDTRLGNTIASSFLSPPTETPPPTQEALNLAYGCPVIEGYPQTLQIKAPTGCDDEQTKISFTSEGYISKRQGNWSHPQGEQIINWVETCDLLQAVLPLVAYTMPDGQAFAFSRTRFSFFGNTMEILDCGLNIQYTLEEKIYHQTSFTDQEKCKKYGSCSGTVFTQYFLRNRLGVIIAETPYLNLFQDVVIVQEPGSGLLIANVSRIGQWSPWARCPDYERNWQIKYSVAPPGQFTDPAYRWPIAVLVNMMILRDADRTKGGMVMPSLCEVVNISILAFLILITIILVIILTWMFHTYCLAKAKVLFYNVEVTFFPHTMYKPSKYEG
jgi:hypothetical protein